MGNRLAADGAIGIGAATTRGESGSHRGGAASRSPGWAAREFSEM